jgi:hypothetical protein
MENEQIIWEYIDGTMSKENRLIVEQKLADDSKFRNEYYQILAIHNSFLQEDLEMPSMAFDYKVLSQLSSFKTPSIKSINIHKVLYITISIFAIILAVPVGILLKNRSSISNQQLFDVDTFSNGIFNVFTNSYFSMILALLLMSLIIDFARKRMHIITHQ